MNLYSQHFSNILFSKFFILLQTRINVLKTIFKLFATLLVVFLVFLWALFGLVFCVVYSVRVSFLCLPPAGGLVVCWCAVAAVCCCVVVLDAVTFSNVARREFHSCRQLQNLEPSGESRHHDHLSCRILSGR